VDVTNLDQSFGTNGFAVNSLDATFDTGAELSTVLLDNGKYFVLTHQLTGSDADLVLIRYNANGSVDTTFNGTGSKIINLGEYGQATSLVVQPDGKILIGGMIPGATQDIFVKRLKADGSLDTEFHGDGSVVLDFGDNEFNATLALRPDGEDLALQGHHTSKWTNRNGPVKFGRYVR